MLDLQRKRRESGPWRSTRNEKASKWQGQKTEKENKEERRNGTRESSYWIHPKSVMLKRKKGRKNVYSSDNALSLPTEGNSAHTIYKATSELLSLGKLAVHSI